MKYAIIKCTDGNFAVHAEGYTDIKDAKIAYHQLCAALWNDPSTTKAMVKIMDEQLDCAEACREYIYHAVPEPDPEPVEE